MCKLLMSRTLTVDEPADEEETRVHTVDTWDIGTRTPDHENTKEDEAANDMEVVPGTGDPIAPVANDKPAANLDSPVTNDKPDANLDSRVTNDKPAADIYSPITEAEPERGSSDSQGQGQKRPIELTMADASDVPMWQRKRDKPTLQTLKQSRDRIEELEAKVSKWLNESRSFTTVLNKLSDDEIILLRRSDGILNSLATMEDDPELAPSSSSDDV